VPYSRFVEESSRNDRVIREPKIDDSVSCAHFSRQLDYDENWHCDDQSHALSAAFRVVQRESFNLLADNVALSNACGAYTKCLA